MFIDAKKAIDAQRKHDRIIAKILEHANKLDF